MISAFSTLPRPTTSPLICIHTFYVSCSKINRHLKDNNKRKHNKINKNKNNRQNKLAR